MIWKFFLLFLSNFLCDAGQGSYNSFRQQVGFCKQQGFDTTSRATSRGPSVFVNGNVMIGVGLSNDMFADSISSCGRCLEITHIENFWTFDKALTNYSYDAPWPANASFMAMVMDQCKDAICHDGFLDFDIYCKDQPTRFGNPQNIEWSFVDCPVGQEPLELLFCLGPYSCQEGNLDDHTLLQVWDEAKRSAYFSMYIRNARVPVVGVNMVVEDALVPLADDQGWKWSTPDLASFLAEEIWNFQLTTSEGHAVEALVNWSTLSNATTSSGYRGGVLYTTNIQV
jgi:hypothetical protein